jgi:hypothetical protein
MALPAPAAASIRGAWEAVGVTITTASIDGSSIAASGSATTLAP